MYDIKCIKIYLWNKILFTKTSPFPSNLNWNTFVKSTGAKEDKGISTEDQPEVGTIKV